MWPLSRTHFPKQFLRLGGDRSLLQNTVERVRRFCNHSKLIAVANENHRFLLAEQLRECEINADILLEPAARNTAPAIAAAALRSQNLHSSPLLLVLPSDHIISDVSAFHCALECGITLARAGSLVTFGVLPDRPETGYGYIERGAPIAAAFEISKFVEKPDAATALKYVASGRYYWNSGMFLFRADVFLQALNEFAPAIAAATKNAVTNARVDMDFIRLDEQAFQSSPSDSIDYAVMEKARNRVVVPLNAGWNDMGAWDALYTVGEPDSHDNRVVGDVVLHDARNCYIHSQSRLVAVLGMSNAIVVETPDAVLVSDKSRAQDVKHLVAQLKKNGRTETEFHTAVHRPWGSFETLVVGDRYKVKRIIVKPGRSLSLQQHEHRAEHWVVVSGTAQVTRDGATFVLSANESAYIPIRTVHRLKNIDNCDLEVIEVQSGNYLGEDDIVRFEDHYGRKHTQ